MDPDANLREQLELAAHRLNGGDMTKEEWDAEADRLAELVQALDGWMRGGGFAPKAWGKR